MVRCVVEAQRSLIAEVETAIASGSADKRVETLRRVTDLFMVGSERYSEAQVDVFDDVISKLAERIEAKARAELANRLAPVKNAPTTIVRALARDELIEVAGPVLSQSARLTEEDLLACANGSKGQDRLLAISKRATISEAVSEVLVARGDRDVVRSVARNEGARFSQKTFGKLVERSADDEELAVSVGMRKDIPKEHFDALVSKASEAVFKKLAAGNPAMAAEVNRVLFDLTGHKRTAEQPKVKRDYTHAKRLFDLVQRANQPVDPAVREFAQAGKFEETVVALSALCALPIAAVENIMTDRSLDNDIVLILAKGSGLSWQTTKLILQLRGGEGGLSPQALEKAFQHFERLQAATAKRVVRFYQVRQAATDKSA
jgi:uncharacterized protein (DUF2336 family)